MSFFHTIKNPRFLDFMRSLWFLGDILKFFDSLTTEIYDEYQPKENGWVNEIESESLRKGVSQLSDADRELLTLYAFQEYSITEIAQLQGVSRPTVSKKLTRIRRFLQKFLPMATK